MKFSFLFPGQGSQSLGMLSELAPKFPLIKNVFYRASEVLHYDIWDLCQNGPEVKLNKTEFTQTALLAADYALWKCWLHSGGKMPVSLAGHSVGEYAALVAAEALSFESGIELVALRGKAMQSAVPEGIGAMAAIIGLDEKEVREVCQCASNSQLQVRPANFNSIGQIVISGHLQAVEKAILLAKDSGAKLTKKIPVSVPSHCELMTPAALQLGEKLKTVSIQTPCIPVLHNADVSQNQTAEAIRAVLTRQLTDPVQWTKIIKTFLSEGVELFWECGPGRVLAGLNKRITKTVSTNSVENYLKNQRF